MQGRSEAEATTDPSRPFSRRAVTGAILGAVLAAASPALAQSAGPFSSVSADVTRLRELGLGDYAEFMRAALQRELQAAFADRLAPGGPRLVVRITGLSMRDYVGGDSNRFGFGAGTPNDYLEGEALVLGRRGEVLLRHPQLSALPASSGGAWYDERSEGRRVSAIAQHYALWLRRQL